MVVGLAPVWTSVTGFFGVSTTITFDLCFTVEQDVGAKNDALFAVLKTAVDLLDFRRVIILVVFCAEPE